jgi:hypothetical protein
MVAGGHASGDAVLGVTLSFTILAVFAACLRLLTRLFISKAAGSDDVFVAVSTVSYLSTLYSRNPADEHRSSQSRRPSQFGVKVGIAHSFRLTRANVA